MIEINNLVFPKVNKKFLKKVAKTVLKNEGKKNFCLSIALIGNSRMKKLNKKYLKRNYSTDVLSFPEVESCPKSNNLGEIIICPQVVKSNAKKYNLSFKEEISKVLIHSILHLLGYDHEKLKKDAKLMEEKEKYYLSYFNFKSKR